MARKSRNQKLVQGCEQAIDAMKYEIAQELGLPVGGAVDVNSEFASELGTNSSVKQEAYWGDIASRDAGAVGGHITARLIRNAESVLGQL